MKNWKVNDCGVGLRKMVNDAVFVSCDVVTGHAACSEGVLAVVHERLGI
jgi:hypothetical protein